MFRGITRDLLDVHGLASSLDTVRAMFSGEVDEARGPEKRGVLASIARAVSAPVPVAAEVLPPQLVPDFYWREGTLPAAKILDARPAGCEYAGAMLKATQGASYFSKAREWFVDSYAALANKPRGADPEVPFGVLSYHYTELYGNKEYALRQGRFYLSVRRAAGVPITDPWVLDVEGGGKDAKNRKASRQQVIDIVSTLAEFLRGETGSPGILYGGSLLSNLGIKDRMGCSWVWPAAYSATFKKHEYDSIGFKLGEVFAWQYTDGDVSYAVTTKGVRLPRVIPGVGGFDCSILMPKLRDAAHAYQLLRTARL